jgi:hypothetical protein
LDIRGELALPSACLRSSIDLVLCLYLASPSSPVHTGD